MSDRNYLGAKLIGKQVRLTDPHPSVWIIVEKVKETHQQSDEKDAALGEESYATGQFVCQMVDNPDTRALMKIYMQIAHLGAEFLPADQRATLATRELCAPALSELRAFGALAESGSESTPALLGYSRVEQSQDDFVPGGYILCLAVARVPGERLGPDIIGGGRFWSFPEDKRHQIRRAFKAAYSDLLKAGIEPVIGGPANLVWDDALGKMSVYQEELLGSG